MIMVGNDLVTQEDQKRNKMESNNPFIQCNSLKLCPLINELIKHAWTTSKIAARLSSGGQILLLGRVLSHPPQPCQAQGTAPVVHGRDPSLGKVPGLLLLPTL